MRLHQLQQLPAHDLKVVDLLAWLEAVALLIHGIDLLGFGVSVNFGFSIQLYLSL
jgi:hypothetical protein